MSENIIKEYLGMVFIQELRDYCDKMGSDFESGWRMQDKDYEFIKFDLEYVYYKKKWKKQSKQ